jgi:Protein of unknown function (DUF3485)
MRFLPLIVGGSLLLASGLVHGLWTNRWLVANELQNASAQLESLPMKLGDWEGRPQEMDARQMTVAEAAGHVSRRYVHRRTAAEVSLLVLAGRPGPLAVHQPEVCYAGSGFVQLGHKERWEGPADSPLRGNSFWATRFTRSGTEPQTLRVFHAWGPAGDWMAADKPRLAFARLPALYKLYVVRRLSAPDEPLDKDPALDFLRVAVPELRKCLTDVPIETPVDHLVARLPN